MNEFTRRVAQISSLLLGIALLVNPAVAQTLTFSKTLTPKQATCLNDIVKQSAWKADKNAYPDMLQTVQVAKVNLNSKGLIDYVYIMVDGIDWCGTAGCQMLIGELRRDGTCRLLYDGTGDRSFTVLGRLDHGYRRIWTPCEARFDGREYQQLREDCPRPGLSH